MCHNIFQESMIGALIGNAITIQLILMEQLSLVLTLESPKCSQQHLVLTRMIYLDGAHVIGEPRLVENGWNGSMHCGWNRIHKCVTDLLQCQLPAVPPWMDIVVTFATSLSIMI